MISKNRHPVDWEAFLAERSRGKILLQVRASNIIFDQGDTADSIFYVRRGRVSLAATSPHGKETMVAIVESGEFFGEGCLAGQSLRMATAAARTDCELVRIEKPLMARMLHEQHAISERFGAHLLTRNNRYQEDLVDRLFGSTEQRLARILLLLGDCDKESRSVTVLPRISQENLAQLVGTTRSRVRHFMNKFSKLGFIDYAAGLTVHSGLLSVVLHD